MTRRRNIMELEDGTIVVHFSDDNCAAVIEWERDWAQNRTKKKLTIFAINDLKAEARKLRKAKPTA